MNLNSGLSVLVRLGLKNSFVSLIFFGWEIKIAIKLGTPNDTRSNARRN